MSENNIEIIYTNGNVHRRRIIESLYIKVNDPNLNRNVGKIDITDVYDKVLKEKGELRMKIHNCIPKIKIVSSVNEEGVTIRSSYVINN